MNPTDSSQSFVYETVTPLGRGAVAVITVAGVGAEAALDACFLPAAKRSLADIKRDIIYGVWKSTGEDLLLVRGGCSGYEIQCHGSQVAIDAITCDLDHQGGVESAFKAESDQPDDVETFRREIEGLINRSKTERTATLLLEQWKRFPEAVQSILDTQPQHRAQHAAELMSHAQFGLNFHRSRSVVFCGCPNVGKSSLINCVLGFERAIVNHTAGTTRDVVTEGSAVDGWPVVFSDTAGLRDAVGEIEKLGIEKAIETIQSADVSVGIVDGLNIEHAYHGLSPDIIVVNKMDLIDHDTLDQLLGSVRREYPLAACIATSAQLGDGIQELLAAIAQKLCPNLPPADSAFPVTQNQIDWLARQ